MYFKTLLYGVQTLQSLSMKLPYNLTLRHAAHIALLVGQTCFSGWHIVGSLTMKKGADPFLFAMYREVLSSILMYAVIYFRGESHHIYIEKVDIRRFLFLGLCSFINVVGAMFALQLISATKFAIFQPVIPCIATGISIMVGLESISALKGFGILLAVGGAILSEAWSGGDDDDKNVVLGSIIVTIQVIGMACLVVFSKAMVTKYPPAVVTFLYYTIGTVYTIILCGAWAFQFSVSDLFFDGEILPWVALGYAVVFATVFTYNIISWAGKLLPPSTVTVYCTFQPVGTIILSFLILGSVISVPEIVGALLVILGLLVTVYSIRLASANRTSSDDESDDVREKLASVNEDNGITNRLISGEVIDEEAYLCNDSK